MCVPWPDDGYEAPELHFNASREVLALLPREIEEEKKESELEHVIESEIEAGVAIEAGL